MPPDLAGTGGPLKLGKLVAERLPISVTRSNLLRKSEDEPETVEVIVQGFVYGPTCPGLVKAELASVHDRYVQATRDGEGQFRRNPAAWHTYLREVITALVPGLTPDEIDVLAGEDDFGTDGSGTTVLRYLKFWRQAEQAGADDDPEAVGEGSSTTDDSSPTSAAPTAGPPLGTGSASPSA